MSMQESSDFAVPAAELSWRFSRSQGPGGQHVNTSDSRAELTWSIADSLSLTEEQRAMLISRLGSRVIAGAITVSASEQRSQLRNRESALNKLAKIVHDGLAPEGPKRRATKPTRGSKRRRLATKNIRSQTKQLRRRPGAE